MGRNISGGVRDSFGYKTFSKGNIYPTELRPRDCGGGKEITHIWRESEHYCKIRIFSSYRKINKSICIERCRSEDELCEILIAKYDMCVLICVVYYCCTNMH